MSSTDKITREEMVEMFGDAMPIEAVKLAWEAPDNMTVGEVRSALRSIAQRYAEEREAADLLDECMSYNTNIDKRINREGR